MTMKKIFITAIFAALCVAASAANNDEESSDKFEIRLGWSVGGTMPLDMPASIRGLNEYRLCANFQLAGDYEHKFSEHIGVEAGLKLEQKGMYTDAKVKDYKMSMVKSGEEINGNFTGNVVTDASMLQVAVPVLFAYHPSSKVKVKVGPYVAFALTKGFEGYAYDGYLRQDSPTGPRIVLGSSSDERGSYDFEENLRNVTWGVDLGCDWYVSNKLGVYADLSWGMDNVFHSSFTTIEQTMQPVYGTVGLVFKLNK